jgi:hypothetical protein
VTTPHPDAKGVPEPTPRDTARLDQLGAELERGLGLDRDSAEPAPPVTVTLPDGQRL